MSRHTIHLGATIFASSHTLPGGYTYDGSDYLNKPKSQSDPSKLHAFLNNMTYVGFNGCGSPRKTYDLRIFRSGEIMSKTTILKSEFDDKFSR